MKHPTTNEGQEKDSQLGATDQIEQLAADLARKDNRSEVTAKDREQAYTQMRSMAPAPGKK